MEVSQKRTRRTAWPSLQNQRRSVQFCRGAPWYNKTAPKLAAVATRSIAVQMVDPAVHEDSLCDLKQLGGTQRLQHRIQRTLDHVRDPSQQLPARSPTSLDRTQAIALDMNALNQSCSVESATSQRRKRRSEKRACSDTIEESSSSADRVDPQRKRARCCKEPSPPSPTHTSRPTFPSYSTSLPSDLNSQPPAQVL